MEGCVDEDDDWVDFLSPPLERSAQLDWRQHTLTCYPDNQQEAASHGQRRMMIGWGWWRRYCRTRQSEAGDDLKPCVNNTPQGLTTHRHAPSMRISRTAVVRKEDCCCFLFFSLHNQKTARQPNNKWCHIFFNCKKKVTIMTLKFAFNSCFVFEIVIKY